MRIHYLRHLKKNQGKDYSISSIGEKNTMDSFHEIKFEDDNFFFNSNNVDLDDCLLQGINCQNNNFYEFEKIEKNSCFTDIESSINFFNEEFNDNQSS